MEFNIDDCITLAKSHIYCSEKEKPEFIEKIDRITLLCKEAVTKEEFFELVDIYSELFKAYIMSIKTIYNTLIGWALPSKLVCETVYATYLNHIKAYPDAKIIDLGAGSGIFSYMFHQMGIPNDRIIAVDLEKPTHSNPEQRKFWNITKNSNFEFDPIDILFVAWGSGIYGNVDKYCDNGGTCVIILGETGDGCTFPSDYLSENEQWTVESHHVPGPASAYSEYLTVNIKK